MVEKLLLGAALDGIGLALVYDGGDEIQGYVVEFRPVGSARFQSVSDVYGVRTPLTQTRVTSLDNDEEFEFRVAAVNRAGVGEWSPLSQVVKTRKPDGLQKNTLKSIISLNFPLLLNLWLPF